MCPLQRPTLGLQEFATRTVADLLDGARGFGDDWPLLVAASDGAALTYGAFLERVSGAACALRERFAPGSRIACMLGNSTDYLILRYALSCAGLVEVAINGQHRDMVLRRMLAAAGPTAIVVADPCRGHLLACGYDLGRTELIGEESLAAIAGATAPWESRPMPDIRAEDPCRILFTSGTSGWSKAVELSHGYEVFTGQRHVDLLDIGPEDRWLYVTPLFHIDAIYIFSILLHTGGAFVLAPRFSASRFWADVQRSGATYLCYVGSILPILLKGGDPPTLLKGGDPPALLKGGDPPPGHPLRMAVGGGTTREQLEGFEQRFNVTVLEAFAMTECIACTFNTAADRRLGSVGRPVPGYEVTILDGDGTSCRPGVAGEIAVRTREPCGLFTRYVGDPDGTARAMRHGWFHTGDLGSRDEDGYFYYLGRMKDAIRVRGENVSAIELESIADQHPDVAASAAVGVPAELGEDDILLYVELNPSRAPDARAIFDHIAARAPRFMVPRYLRFMERLPRTATEKVQKSALPRAVDSETVDRDRSATAAKPS
jgi:crotonobetaine/carnitine-CoA ligase